MGSMVTLLGDQRRIDGSDPRDIYVSPQSSRLKCDRLDCCISQLRFDTTFELLSRDLDHDVKTHRIVHIYNAQYVTSFKLILIFKGKK